jgi:hypothetical protein
MMKQTLAAAIACIGLTGSVAPASAGLLSSTGAVIAIMGGELYTGTAEGHLNGAGTLAIHSKKDASLTCKGNFTSSAELGGNGKLNCSDGSSSTFQFKRLNLYQGHGGGTFNKQKAAMSFAYGLTAEEAKPYLKLPKGKKLEGKGERLELVSL